MSEGSIAVSARPKFTHLKQFFVSCLWLAYNVQWGALLFIVLPHQVEALVGSGKKEDYLGLILPTGALVSLLITPIAGALSDRCRSRLGRRKPFLIAGVLISCAFLLLLGLCGRGTNVWLFTLCFLGLQFGSNWWGGPYAGLIPDVVPEEMRGSASGWQALMTAIGTIVGVVAAAALLRFGSYLPVYGMIVALLILLLGLTLWGVHESPLAVEPPPLTTRGFLRSFLLDPKEYRNFYWVLATRAMQCMGVYSISPFFQYFLQDVIHAPRPADATALLMLVIIGMGIPTSILAGIASDRYGRKPLVYLSGGLMALAAGIYIAVTFSPSMGVTLIVGGVFGIGNGAYQAVDWALALDVLPSGDDAAKDMGIWHVAIVLPQILATAIAGKTLGAVKHQSLLLAYTVVFTMAAVWFVLATVFVRKIRGVR